MEQKEGVGFGMAVCDSGAGRGLLSFEGFKALAFAVVYKSLPLQPMQRK